MAQAEVKKMGAVQKVFESRDAQVLFDFFFDQRDQRFKLTPKQKHIVETVLFSEHRRVCVNTMTRYGKTQVLAMTACILLGSESGHEIAIVAPTQDRHEKMRQYMTEAITNSTYLRYLVQLGASNIERLTAESTKKRQTFKNGSSYRFFHASNADQLMSFGAKTVVADEDQDIEEDSQENISRMLGDHPSSSMWIKSFNPVRKDTHTFDAWTSPEWYNIRVDYEDAIREGRTTRAWIEEQKQNTRPWKFKALYECVFPDKTQDSLFSEEWYRDAVEKKRFNLVSEHSIVREQQEREEGSGGASSEGFEYRVGVDVARRGEDKTVITKGLRKGNLYHVTSFVEEDVSDTMGVAREIQRHVQSIREKDKETSVVVVVDGHGVGAGVVDRLDQTLQGYKGVRLVEALFGGRSQKNHIYKNKKAEEYDRLRKVHEDRRIRYPGHKGLLRDLTRIKTDFTGSDKMKIVSEGDKSPDYSDSLTYFVWRDMEEASFGTLRL